MVPVQVKIQSTVADLQYCITHRRCETDGEDEISVEILANNSHGDYVYSDDILLHAGDCKLIANAILYMHNEIIHAGR